MPLSKRKKQAAWLAQNRAMVSVELPFARELEEEKNRYVNKCAERFQVEGNLSDVDFEEHKQNMGKLFAKYVSRIITATSLNVQRMVFGSEKKASLWEFLFMKWLSDFGAEKVTQISETTKSDVQKAISTSTAEGLFLAGTVSKIRSVAQLSKWRAATIAKTEIHAASQYASVESAKQLEAESESKMLKEWVPALQARTRDWHAAMASHPPIPIGQKFTVNGERMDRPGDPAGSGNNTINCRCVLVYEFES